MSAETNAPAPLAAVGKPALRRDLAEKLVGEARFAADVRLAGALVGKILRSPHPHARVLSVDVSAALDAPGVRAAVTPFDCPLGRVAPDVPILDTKARFVGDEVAAIAADDDDAAEYALSLIKTRYETLPFVTRAEDALRADAPLIHDGGNLAGGAPVTLERGSVSDGFARADFIIEDTFSTPSHASAALEPRAAVADWDGERLTVWKSTRGVHQDRLLLALALGVPRENVRVIGVSMGAGYGGKDETRLSVLAAILARRARKPVKIEASRHEEFVAGRRRHGATTTVRMGVRRDGEITAVHAKTVMDTGAYLSSGPGVVRRAGQGALYLYRCANARYDGWLAYTNTPSGGSYRALGAPQGHFALEMIADRAAQAVGMDALDFRLKNHVGIEGQPGERTSPPNAIIDTQPVEGGVPFSSNGLRECILKGADAFGWREFAKRADDGHLKRGKGMAIFIYRGGPGGRSIARARLESGGAIRLISGVMDVGEGSYTALSQIAAEALGVDVERIQTTFADTAETPDSPITAGSTATFSAGLAVERAASDLKARILDAASLVLGVSASALYIEGDNVRERGGSAAVSLSRLAAIAGGVEVEAAVTPGSSEYVVNSFGAHFAEVEVNEDTGEVRVVRYVAAHDSGRIVNPTLALNQVEGGVSQMLGFALSEEMLTDAPSGATLNASFLEHKSPTILEYPDIQVIFADVVDPIGPYGAKALGEPPSIGVAPAVTSAIRDAVGVEVKDLPATPQRILDLLEQRERSQA